MTYNPPRDEETRGIALAALTIDNCTIKLLVKRGIIPKEDAVFALNLALESLEAQQMKVPDDVSLQIARAVVQGSLDVLLPIEEGPPREPPSSP